MIVRRGSNEAAVQLESDRGRITLKHNVNVLCFWADDVEFLMRAQVAYCGNCNVVLSGNQIGEHSIFMAWNDEEHSQMIGEIPKIQPSRAVEGHGLFVGEHVKDDHCSVRSSFVRGHRRRLSR